MELRAFGTDGEPELIKAFGIIMFPQSCSAEVYKPFMQHVHIKDKLQALNIQQSVSKDFLSDIFGTQIATHFQMGLADAESEAAFTESLQRVKVKWNNLEKRVWESLIFTPGLPLQSRREYEVCSPCVEQVVKTLQACLPPTAVRT